jgi:hypothetical protein
MLAVHDDDVGLMALVLDAPALGIALGTLVALDVAVVVLRGGLTCDLAERRVTMAMEMLLGLRRVLLENVVNPAVRDLMFAVFVMRMGHYFFTFP